MDTQASLKGTSVPGEGVRGGVLPGETRPSVSGGASKVRARNLGCVFPATFTGVRTVKFFYIIHCFWQGNTLGFRQKHHKTTADGRQDTKDDKR